MAEIDEDELPNDDRLTKGYFIFNIDEVRAFECGGDDNFGKTLIHLKNHDRAMVKTNTIGYVTYDDVNRFLLPK